MAKVNRMKLVNMNFNFYATPGTRQRRSSDGTPLGGTSVQIITQSSKNLGDATDDFERNLSAATEEAAKDNGEIVPSNLQAQVTSQAAMVSPNEDISEDLELSTSAETSNRCPTDSCWTYHPETKSCKLKEGCTDVECTSTSIIATD